MDEREQQLARLVTVAREHPGEIVTAFDSGDRAHLLAGADKHEREAARMRSAAAAAAVVTSADGGV